MMEATDRRDLDNLRRAFSRARRTARNALFDSLVRTGPVVQVADTLPTKPTDGESRIGGILCTARILWSRGNSLDLVAACFVAGCLIRTHVATVSRFRSGCSIRCIAGESLSSSPGG
jgi:hypothetical protein